MVCGAIRPGNRREIGGRNGTRGRRDTDSFKSEAKNKVLDGLFIARFGRAAPFGPIRVDRPRHAPRRVLVSLLRPVRSPAYPFLRVPSSRPPPSLSPSAAKLADLIERSSPVGRAGCESHPFPSKRPLDHLAPERSIIPEAVYASRVAP